MTMRISYWPDWYKRRRKQNAANRSGCGIEELPAIQGVKPSRKAPLQRTMQFSYRGRTAGILAT